MTADLQELFRADMERWLVCMINQNIIRAEHTIERDDGWGLTSEGRKTFTAEWEKALNTAMNWQGCPPAKAIALQIRALRRFLCGDDGCLSLACGREWLPVSFDAGEVLLPPEDPADTVPDPQ